MVCYTVTKRSIKNTLYLKIHLEDLITKTRLFYSKDRKVIIHTLERFFSHLAFILKFVFFQNETICFLSKGYSKAFITCVHMCVCNRMCLILMKNTLLVQCKQ